MRVSIVAARLCELHQLVPEGVAGCCLCRIRMGHAQPREFRRILSAILGDGLVDGFRPADRPGGCFPELAAAGGFGALHRDLLGIQGVAPQHLWRNPTLAGSQGSHHHLVQVESRSCTRGRDAPGQALSGS